MNKFLNFAGQSIRAFAHDEVGAQVIEYALIIAVISIAMVLGLKGLSGDLASFVSRVSNCLIGAAACTASA